MVVAEIGNPDPANQLHDEIGAARVGCPGIQDLRDVGVIHHGECLALGLEAGDDISGVHPQLDHLERDATSHRRFLVGYVNDATAAFPNLLAQLVAADDLSSTLRA